MVAVVRVPDLGSEMVGGVVAEWYRADGSEVSEGEPVCRLECDFIAVEIEATAAGVLRHRRPAGSIERKGAVLGLVVGRGEAMPPDEAVRALEAAAVERLAGQQPPAAPSAARRVEAAAGTSGNDPAPPTGDDRPAVVVPFRRTGGENARQDSAEERAEPLPEPGGEIPGLPLWKDEETAVSDVGAGASPPEPGAPVAGAGGTDPRAERFGRIAREAAASAEVLSACARVNWTRAREAVAALAEEWSPFGPRPTVEDLAVRAIARALAEQGVDAGPAGLVVVEPGADRSYAVEEPLAADFRAAVRARSAGDGSFERADWLAVSLMELGIERVEPRLSGGKLAFGLGADAQGEGTITMRFDSTLLGEGDAGRVLARVRTLVENPYRLWA